MNCVIKLEFYAGTKIWSFFKFSGQITFATGLEWNRTRMYFFRADYKQIH